ncbi:DNA-directed RNA polymerase [Candidatus Pacearchaeota archaeon]|nr:DNA-directed RNA polymerase [Candidatus Pacearchaeota archaeon]|tara:strand:+ start:3436 stop:4041 length:606 start_codon:yes stop_codon:yes gene_type:complete
MFYLIDVEDYIRVEPKLFGLPTREAVEAQLKESYTDHYDNELGFVIAVTGVDGIEEGIIIPGDGAAYYKSNFKLVVWKPEMQELVFGNIAEITNFGAFIDLGAAQGMIHISQTMDDYVSFSKTNTLIGKANKRSLKKGDACIARIVAISYKMGEPKIGLTMRQPGLGKIEWVEADKIKSKKDADKIVKLQAKEARGAKKKK